MTRHDDVLIRTVERGDRRPQSETLERQIAKLERQQIELANRLRDLRERLRDLEAARIRRSEF